MKAVVDPGQQQGRNAAQGQNKGLPLPQLDAAVTSGSSNATFVAESVSVCPHTAWMVQIRAKQAPSRQAFILQSSGFPLLGSIQQSEDLEEGEWLSWGGWLGLLAL